MRYALIRGNHVFTVVEQSSPPQPGDLFDLAVPAGNASPGWTWDGSQLAPPAAPSFGTKITRAAFRQRFTAAEREDIEIAALDDPAGTANARRAAARLRVFKEDILASDRVDLSAARVRNAVTAMESAGLLAAGRAAAILDAPVRADELQ